MAKRPDTRRRPLTFADLDEVVRDVDGLARDGYDRVGDWDLSQACGHLTEWLRFAVQGYPRGPLPIRLMMGLLRMTMGRSLLKRTLASGKLDAGSPTLKETVPAPAGDAGPAIDELRRAVAAFKAHPGEYQVSPLFGAMSRDEMSRLQLIHCAHHLSFLIPKA